jgi:hypothetical protein
MSGSRFAPTLAAACVAGTLLAGGLGVREAAKTTALTIGKSAEDRQRNVSTVDVAVTNHDSSDQCPEIRIEALDTDGKILQEMRATPIEGADRIPPKSTLDYRAHFDRISARNYREKFKKFSPYVYRHRRC